MSTFRIAIIGSGPSGVAILNKLSRNLDVDLDIEIYMFDNKMVVSPGSPYSISNNYSILNRSVLGMSNYLKDSQDFASWCNGNSFFIGQESNFLPRSIFGNYLFDQLSESSILLKKKGIRFFYFQKLIMDTSIIEENNERKIRLTFDNGSHFDFDHLVSATGNFRNKNPFNFKQKGYIDNPVKLDELDSIGSDNQNPIAILGSGLTACETAIILTKTNPEARILMVSTSGELPPVRGKVVYHDLMFLTEENITDYIAKNENLKAEDVRHILNCELSLYNTSYEQIVSSDLSFSHYYNDAVASKSNWYNVIGATNSGINRLFNHLESFDEKKKFRSIFNQRWIRKRIAIPLETAEELMNLLETGRLTVLKGTINQTDNAYEVTYSDDRKVIVSHVINATGFTDKIDRNAPVYIRNLVKTGILSTDDESRGIVDFDSCCAITENGEMVNSIQLTGASTLGTFFFTSAVDIIDEQADKVVTYLIKVIEELKDLSLTTKKRTDI